MSMLGGPNYGALPQNRKDGNPSGIPTTRFGPGAYVPPTGGTYLGSSPQNRPVGSPETGSIFPGPAGTPNAPAAPQPPAAPPYDYHADPGYLALIAGIDFQEGQYQAISANSLSKLDENEPIAQSDLTRRYGIGLDSIDRSLESRGLWHSSERTDKRAQLGGQYTQDAGDITRDYAQRRTDVNNQLLYSLAGTGRQRAETTSRYATPPLPRDYGFGAY